MSVHPIKAGRRTTGYQVRWREEGRQRSKRITRRDDALAFDAQIKLRLRQRRELGSFAASEASPMPLGDFVENAWRTRHQSWAKTTRIMRADVLDAWILPLLATVPLRDLNTERLREFEAQMMTQGVRAKDGKRRRASNDTVNRVRRVLSAFLGYAVEDGLLPENPCRKLRRLAHKPSKHRALPPVLLERIRAAMTDRDAVMVSLMYLAGLRPEEALALQWRHVGVTTILIEQAATEGEIKETKTTTSTAPVELLRPLAIDLQLLRARVRPQPTDLVVTGRQGDGVMTLRYWRAKRWHRARVAAQVERCTPYDGRHTFGSLLIHEGRDILEVQRQMRHASSTITLGVYAHEFAEWRGRAKVTLEQAVLAARRQVAAELREALEAGAAGAGGDDGRLRDLAALKAAYARTVEACDLLAAPAETTPGGAASSQSVPTGAGTGSPPDGGDRGSHAGMGRTGLEPVTPSLSSLPTGDRDDTPGNESTDAEGEPGEPAAASADADAPDTSPRVPKVFPPGEATRRGTHPTPAHPLGRCEDCATPLSQGLEGTFCDPCEVECPACQQAGCHATCVVRLAEVLQAREQLRTRRHTPTRLETTARRQHAHATWMLAGARP